MPILRNAKKALRVSHRKALHNRQVKSRLKTEMDKMIKSPSLEALKNVFSAIDKALKKNILHRNKAARLKSRMSRLVSSK